MKTIYEKVFASHVAAKLTKAAALGISASWTSANHLDALAEACQLEGVDIRDCLGECYNISAYQQMLAKKFAAAKSPHFQREEKKTPKQEVDDVISQLAAGSVAKPAQTPTEEKKSE